MGPGRFTYCYPPWVFGKEPPHIGAVMAPCAGKAPVRTKFLQQRNWCALPGWRDRAGLLALFYFRRGPAPPNHEEAICL